MNSKANDYQDSINLDGNIIRKLSYHEHETLKNIAKAFSIRVGARGDTINFLGVKAPVLKAKEFISHMAEMMEEGIKLDPDDIRHAAFVLAKEKSKKAKDVLGKNITIQSKGCKDVNPRTKGQREYVEALQKNDLVLAVGPAGTGKTFLAMTLAVKELLEEKINRIILTRPAVEAGEKLGFLPGSLEEKVSPYLRPLYDALFDLVGTDKAEELVAHGIIEIAPLAFMRGRTLNDAFIILDEAQNTTPEQMKMALTRIGFGSKMVVTGDITQIDLPKGQKSGLKQVLSLLKKISGVSICALGEKDVVRHPLVQSIIKAYGKSNKK